MAPIQDPNVSGKPPLWKVVLNLVYTSLGVLKGMGLFTKKQGPDIK